ncbi:MAG: DNRLRE domain-containing protein [Candidatus Bathyarchaeia archaeon]
MKRLIIFTLFAFLLFSISLFSLHAQVVKTITLHPIADSYVDSSNPDNNYGGSKSLFVENLKFEYIPNIIMNSYLMFNLSSLPVEASIQSAVLTINIFWIGSTTKIYVHYCPSFSWSELSITWNNAPEYEKTPISMAIITKSGKSPPFEVTQAVQRAWVTTKAFTLVLTSEEKTGIGDFLQFISKESTWEEGKPQLKIEYTIPSTSVDSTVTAGALLILVLIIIGAIITYKISKRRRRPKAIAVPKPAAQVKYCINCGALMPLQAKYCPQCAAKQPEL